MPAGTSTELVRNGSSAITSADGDVADRSGGRVCGAANGYAPRAAIFATASCWARSATVAANRCQAMSGSGPLSNSTSRPFAS